MYLDCSFFQQHTEVTNQRFTVIDPHHIPSFTQTQQSLQLLAATGEEGERRKTLLEEKKNRKNRLSKC